MARPITIDKQLVVDLFNAGIMRKHVAQQARCSRSHASKIFQMHKQTNSGRNGIVTFGHNELSKKQAPPSSSGFEDELIFKLKTECKRLMKENKSLKEDNDGYTELTSAQSARYKTVKETNERLDAENKRLAAEVEQLRSTRPAPGIPIPANTNVSNVRYIHQLYSKPITAIYKLVDDLQRNAASEDMNAACALGELGYKFINAVNSLMSMNLFALTGKKLDTSDVDFDVDQELKMTEDVRVIASKKVQDISSVVSQLCSANRSHRALQKLHDEIHELDLLLDPPPAD